MKTVRMLIGISGMRDGIPWPVVGETIEVPDGEAFDLLNAGYAEEASNAKTSTPSNPEATDGGAPAAAPAPKRTRSRK
jgi:hypothetical protein